MNVLDKATTVAETKYVHDKLQGEIDIIAGIVKVESWADVQKIVRAGMASKIFSIGDQLTCQRGNDTLVWDIIGIDHDTPADPQFTHSLTLQLHDCFPTTMQFDAPEALYYCESALAAGTYHFAYSGTDYQFTTSAEIAEGSQLILGFTSDVPSAITVASTKGGAVSEGSIEVSAGSGGTELATNDISRARFGSNNYKESAIRQWLNSSAAAGSVWTPQTDFDRPPSWAASTAGFMNGMDADFLAVIGKTHIVVARNTVCDGGGYDETDDYFFLPSKSEIYGGVEVSGVDEGTAYPYYADYSDLSAAGAGADSNRIKYRAGAAQYWWLRSPAAGYSYYPRLILPTGTVSSYYAGNNFGIALACNII